MNIIPSPKFKMITLGCKVNQYETQGMREILCRAGFVSSEESSEAVDYVIVNTCTVTAEADKVNRYWIRRARREFPSARIIVTGCGVERNRLDYEKMSEVNFVLRNHEKAEIANRIFEGCGAPSIQDAVHQPSRLQFTPLSISETQGFGRAFVKIQDGCNHACTFCKVVLVRGRSRSRDIAEIVGEVIRLRDVGYREIVFAGIQLGAYGLDFESHFPDLPEVLKACSEIEGIERLRLSSIEPTDIRPKLIQALRKLPKFCPQIHIPLQSGDDHVLKAMNRRYGRDFYRELICQLREARPDFCLTLDVMAGFPSEEESHFLNTLDLVREIRPLKCHVFPYSRREGTLAAKIPDLPIRVVKERVQHLIQLAQTLSLEVRTPFLGKRFTVLAESYDSKTQTLEGFTAHYLKVRFPGSEEQIGQMIPVTLLALEGEGFIGDLET